MTVPIVPGPPQPDEPTEQWQPAAPPPYYQPPPVYYAPPPGYQPANSADVVKKSAIGTVTVIVTLIGVFCVLPAVACAVLALIGQTVTYPTP